MSRARTLLTGLIALVTLIAAVAGLPVVLYRFGGSPLPQHLASWQHLRTVLTSRDNGSLLIGLIRDLSWLAWLLFSIAVLAEIQAAARGRRAPRLWLGALQGGAARLVALAALTFAASPGVSLAASASPVATAHAWPAARPAAQPDGIRLVSVGAPVSQGADQGTAESRSVTVRPGDCLWSIAARYLGAGDRYPEIAGMNYGHEMGAGQVFTNPSLIEPGWRLTLPAPASPDEAGPASTGAAHHLGHATKDTHYRRRHAAAHEHGAQPASPAAAPAPDGASVRPAAQASYQSPANDAGAGERLPEAAVFAAGALAGAVLTSLGRLRSKQRQYRRLGRRIALPADPQVLAAERKLRAAAPTAGPVATLPDALRLLEAGILDAGHVLPDIVGLHVTPDVLEVLLAAPALDSPPPPYMISPGRQGMCWQLALPARGAPDGAGPDPAAVHGSGLLPGLFTAGSTDAGYLLLDLEALQVTGCDGPPDLVDQVLTAAATELSTGQWSGWYDLILVGFDELGVLGRAEHCPTLADALRLLDERAVLISSRLTGEPPADLRQLRLAAPDDEDWGLTILVSRVEPEPGEMLHLLALAEDGPGGIAALVAGDPETDDGRMAPTVLQVAPDPERTGEILANVVPLQIVVRPQTLTAAEYEAISTLFAVAADLTDVSPEQVPYALYGAPPWIPDAAVMDPGPAPWTADGPPAETPEPDAAALAAEAVTGWHDASEFASPTATRLEVRILGQFGITGARERLQPKQSELVLALALAAPGGLSNSALRSVLGADPDHPKPADAVRQIITRSRRRLGRAGDGREFIIHSGSGNYQLHPDAWLDWTEFRDLVAGGRAEELRAALALVRGEPFAGSYYWWIDIPLLETVRAEIVDAAETLGEFELATGIPRAAARAARAGLAAEAAAEPLWRLLMRAEHAAGNTAGVAEAWRRCIDAIEDVAPGGEPHPDTAALYRQLTGAARQHAPMHG